MNINCRPDGGYMPEKSLHDNAIDPHRAAAHLAAFFMILFEYKDIDKESTCNHIKNIIQTKL